LAANVTLMLAPGATASVGVGVVVQLPGPGVDMGVVGTDALPPPVNCDMFAIVTGVLSLAFEREVVTGLLETGVIIGVVEVREGRGDVNCVAVTRFGKLEGELRGKLGNANFDDAEAGVPGNVVEFAACATATAAAAAAAAALVFAAVVVVPVVVIVGVVGVNDWVLVEIGVVVPMGANVGSGADEVPAGVVLDVNEVDVDVDVDAGVDVDPACSCSC
jgi:hypothetical protein